MLLYQSEEGAVEGKFIIGEDALWTSRKIVSEIFGTTGPNISMHFKNIVNDGELEEKEVCISLIELFKDDLEFSKKFLQNSKKGGRPQIWYNLDAIISVKFQEKKLMSLLNLSMKNSDLFRISCSSQIITGLIRRQKSF